MAASNGEVARRGRQRPQTDESECKALYACNQVSLTFVYKGESPQALGKSAPMRLAARTSTNVVSFLAQFPYANERPTVAYYNEGSAALQLAIQEALTGVKSPKDALDEAAAKWTQLAGQ